MKNWIISWFKYVETENELSISYNKFNEYFTSIHKNIGDVCVDEITKLVSRIMSKKHNLLNVYFHDVCTFDFIGDSIVEGANFPIKNGPISVSNNMDLSNSAYTQLKSTEAKYTKEIISSAKKLIHQKHGLYQIPVNF